MHFCVQSFGIFTVSFRLSSLCYFSEPEPCRFDVYQYGSYAGDNPDSITTADSAESCLTQCLNDASCSYVSYQRLSMECRLYSAVTTMTDQEGAATYAKSCSAGKSCWLYSAVTMTDQEGAATYAKSCSAGKS